MDSVGTQSTGDVVKPEPSCRAIDEKSGEICGENRGLQILDEFKKLYEDRIEKVDREFGNEFDRVSMKLQIMMEWIRDLGEQNVMLVSTVEELEQAACSRVQVLEHKLQQSSRLVSENMTRSNYPEEALCTLSSRINQLERDEECLQQRIEFLQSDIRGLLEFIRRGRIDNRWNLDGITFFEIEPSDIPAPVDCTCDKEQIDSEKLRFLKLQVEKLQENEKKALCYRAELEEKLADLNAKLSKKEETIRKYVSQLQGLSDNLKKHSKIMNQVTYNSLTTSSELDPDIFFTPDIVENILTEKDLETKRLRQKLQDAESKLSVFMHESDADVSNLRMQLEEKCNKIQQLEQQMASLQKESAETREALTAEVAEKHDLVMSLRKKVTALEKEAHAKTEIQFKDDIIKEMRKELKQTTLKDVCCPKKVHKEAAASQEDINTLSDISGCYQEKIMSYLTNTKLLMKKEKEALFDLKVELEKILQNVYAKEKEVHKYDVTTIYEKLKDIEMLLKQYRSQTNDCSEPVESIRKCIDMTESHLNYLRNILQNKCAICCMNEKQLCESNVGEKLTKTVDNILKICSEKEKAILFIDGMVRDEKLDHICNVTPKDIIPNATVIEQFKLMEEFRMCTVEAQAATEDIREEIDTVLSTFNSRHQKYQELNNVVNNTQDHLTKIREGISEAINRLQINEDERTRHTERVSNGKMKLKDIKNEINFAHSQLSRCISNVQESVEEHSVVGYTEICTCNDLVTLVVEEVEQILSNLQLFQTQGYHISSALTEVRNQVCTAECSLKELQKKTKEVLLANETSQMTFCERERKLEKLEEEIDCAHTKMQDVLETFLSTREQDITGGSSMCNYIQSQATTEVIRAKEELHKLKKEYDDFRLKTVEQASQEKYNENMEQLVTDLQDQVRELQHELKCKQEANTFLKNNITSLEKELSTVQAKADNHRRCHSVDSIELNKKILELENTIKTQKEVESNLRTSLSNNEMELKKSKELLNSIRTEYDPETMLVRSGYQFKHENVPQLFKTVQEAMQSTRDGLRDLEIELKNLVCEGSSHSRTSTRSVMTLMTLIDKLGNYEERLDKCSQEIEKLKGTLCSKDKLLENMDEIIRIQKDSITMTQAELKDLHQKLQEKIDMQDRVISQYEKEKSELLKQNELQVQTIGHLQNAVVEAKRCLDHMGHKTMSDLREKGETIRILTIYIDETQSQYNECFAEAAEQDRLLDLQRDAIESLQEKIRSMERDKYLIINMLHSMYYSVLNIIQEQLQARVTDFRILKYEINSLIQTKNSLENKYINMKKLWHRTSKELQELKTTSLKDTELKTEACRYNVKMEDKECATEDLFNSSIKVLQEHTTNLHCERDLEVEIIDLRRENEDMKKQLQMYKLDCEALNEQFKLEKENSACLEQVKAELQMKKDTENDRIQELQELYKKLQDTEKKEISYKKQEVKLEKSEKEIKSLYNQIADNEAIIREYAQTIEELQRKLELNEQRVKEYIFELSGSKEMLNILRDRVHSLKALLKEKSDNMAKLQADYEVLKNENSILKTENNVFENKAKDDICQLKKKIKDVQSKLYVMEDNYHRATQDFNRTQEQLIETAKREADLQESLTTMEKSYSSKLANAETEENRLGDLIDSLNEELEDIRRKFQSKNAELCQAQETCKTYASQLDIIQRDIEKERQKVLEAEHTNRDLMQQLQECMDENYSLSRENALLEQNNCKCIAELHDMHESLAELKQECQLKNESLACISAELTQTAKSRSELCNESQYMVSCIRVWMEEQKKLVESLASKLRIKQQHLMQVGFEKKALLRTVKELRRINNVLTQRLKRTHRPAISKTVKNACTRCYIVPPQIENKCSIGPIRTSRRTSVCGNSWWFPKMEYLMNELRKDQQWWNMGLSNRTETDTTLDESRDCGYQSSTSK